MNREIKARINVWLTTLPEPFDIATTTIDGMETQGWTLITAVELPIDLSDLDIDFKALKEKSLKGQLERINDTYDTARLTIEDSLRTLQET